MEAEAEAATPAAPIPVETVYRTLEAALSFDNATRSAAERQLRDWEGDAAPGFIGSLLKVVAEVAAVPEVRWRRAAGQHHGAGFSRCFWLWHVAATYSSVYKVPQRSRGLPDRALQCRSNSAGGPAHGGGCGQERGGVQLAQNHRQPRVVPRAG